MPLQDKEEMKIISQSGFQKNNPDVVSQRDKIPPIILETKVEKKKRLAEEAKIELADKVMSGRKLTKSERRTIYLCLAGKEPPKGKKRGAPSQKYRDLRLALDYLHRKAEKGTKATKIKQELAEFYKLPGGKDVQEQTFYKALNKGIELLEYYSNLWLKEVDGGYTCDMDSNTVQHSSETVNQNLQSIMKHRKQSKHLKHKIKKNLL